MELRGELGLGIGGAVAEWEALVGNGNNGSGGGEADGDGRDDDDGLARGVGDGVGDVRFEGERDTVVGELNGDCEWRGCGGSVAERGIRDVVDGLLERGAGEVRTGGREFFDDERAERLAADGAGEEIGWDVEFGLSGEAGGRLDAAGNALEVEHDVGDLDGLAGRGWW